MCCVWVCVLCESLHVTVGGERVNEFYVTACLGVCESVCDCEHMTGCVVGVIACVLCVIVCM